MGHRTFTLQHDKPKDERRIWPKAELRVARDDPGKPKTIGGHAFVYNQETDVLWFREVIRPGVLGDNLAGADVRCLFNHNEDLILGRSTAGTLKLFDDPAGLRFECDLPATRVADDLALSIGRRDITQCSFGFYVLQDRWTYYDGEQPDLREILKIELFDVSPVTFPAYPQTDVALRTLQEARDRGGMPPVTASVDGLRRARLRLAEAS